MSAAQSRPMQKRPGRGTSRLLALIGLWAVPVAAVAVSVPLTASLDAQSLTAELPATVTVGSREVDRAIAVQAAVTLGTQPELKSAADGVITQLAESGTIEPGAELFAVDSVPVLAYQGPVLHRDLSHGDRGADVKALSDYLVTLGYLDPQLASDQFGPDLQAAVQQLQAHLGVERDGMFRLSYISYVPEAAHEIAAAVIELGDRVQAGDRVLVAQAPIEAVSLTPISTGNLAAYSGLELALRLGDSLVDISGVEMAGEEAAAVAAALGDAARSGTAQVEVAEVPLSIYSGGILVLRNPITSGAAPSTAVLIDADSRTCLLETSNLEEESPSYIPLVLDSANASTELGTVMVDEAAIGLQVVRDVSALPEEHRTCG